MRVVGSAPGKGVDPKTSILKTEGGEILQQAAELLMEALGPGALTAGFGEHDLDASSAIVSAYSSSRKYSIFGGSNGNPAQHSRRLGAALGRSS